MEFSIRSTSMYIMVTVAGVIGLALGALAVIYWALVDDRTPALLVVGLIVAVLATALGVFGLLQLRRLRREGTPSDPSPRS